MASDLSNGWEAIADRFIAARSDIGTGVVRDWVGRLPAGGAVVDIGCGAGVPVSATLIDAGLQVSGIDASPTLVTAFRQRFPMAQVACEAAEESGFFGRKFDGAVAIGLLFLLPAEGQRAVIIFLRGSRRFLSLYRKQKSVGYGAGVEEWMKA